MVSESAAQRNGYEGSTLRAGYHGVAGEHALCHLFSSNGTDLDKPRPLAAIELIHKQPVRWTHSSKVVCDGGGGPLGHPRIFINVDKPQVVPCTYCGLPYVCRIYSEHFDKQSLFGFAMLYVLTILVYHRHTNITGSTSNLYHPRPIP